MSQIEITKVLVRALLDKTKDMPKDDRIEYIARTFEDVIGRLADLPGQHVATAASAVERAARDCVRDVTTERLQALRGALLLLDDARDRSAQ
jgi:hypothetical protein